MQTQAQQAELIKLPITEEKVILIALAKLLSEQSTYLLNELRHRPKMKYNDMIVATDAFIKEVECLFTDEQKEQLQEITDALHEGMAGLRKDLLKKTNN